MHTVIQKEGCPCGKAHVSGVRRVLAGKGVLSSLPEELKAIGARRVFLLADCNTYAVAGERVRALLEDADLFGKEYVFNCSHLEPDEAAVATAEEHYDADCDTVLALGSGVLGDVAKLLSKTAGAKYAIVATAPSMDGYASASSSMILKGLKVSVPSACAQLIVGDVDILKTAPDEMLRSGLGDMLAKYVSVCDWRISHIVTGEYYCESIASLMRESLEKCVSNAAGLLEREDDAVLAVFEGLVLAGMAMDYAGVSRPASGVEHYFSHVWDMRALEFGDAASTHGIQCAVATLISARLYEKIKEIKPDAERALAFVRDFDLEAYRASLRAFLGKGAEAMIALDERENKYSPEKHRERLSVILERWDDILRVISEEMPSSDEIERILQKIGAPTRPADIGIDEGTLAQAFAATKDIRDKYVLSRLAFDLGVIDEML